MYTGSYVATTWGYAWVYINTDTLDVHAHSYNLVCGNVFC